MSDIESEDEDISKLGGEDQGAASASAPGTTVGEPVSKDPIDEGARILLEDVEVISDEEDTAGAKNGAAEDKEEKEALKEEPGDEDKKAAQEEQEQETSGPDIVLEDSLEVPIFLRN